MTAAGHSEGPAHDVVAEIEAMGGQAAANGDDISSWDGAGNVVKQAIDTFGGLDVVVNNAGILRDRMLVNMTEEEWDAVIKVHLKGTFGVSRFAAAYWRERSKNGESNEARIINTTSPSGIYGNAGQTNYGAAKAGIATFTVIAAMELERYGITVNAIAPTALDADDRGPRARQASEEAEGGHGPPVDRAALHVARVAAVERRHRSGLRGLRRLARGRRGLAPRSEHPAGRRSDRGRRRHPAAPRQGPARLGHVRQRESPRVKS